MVSTLLDMTLLLLGKLLSPNTWMSTFLKTVGLWDSVSELIGVVGWTKFLSLTLPVYERSCRKFLSSLLMDWNARFQDRAVYINSDS